MALKWLAECNGLQQVRFSDYRWERLQLAQDLPNCRLEVWRGPRREELDCYRSQSIAQRNKRRRQLIAVAARTPF